MPIEMKLLSKHRHSKSNSRTNLLLLCAAFLTMLHTRIAITRKVN